MMEPMRTRLRAVPCAALLGLRWAWCDQCGGWKPDRTHHCSELERCVRNMGHFCPWNGGIVRDSTYKFFLAILHLLGANSLCCIH